MSQLTWNDVIARQDLIGGDIVSIENDVVYRGPLSEIRLEGTGVRFNSPWCARQNPETGEWENWHVTTSFVDRQLTTPYEGGEGSVSFHPMYGSGHTIFPKGYNTNLDPSQVKGLEVNTC